MAQDWELRASEQPITAGLQLYLFYSCILDPIFSSAQAFVAINNGIGDFENFLDKF